MKKKPNALVFITAFAFAFFISDMTAANPGHESLMPRPNVLLIIVDDQGYGDIGAHGHPFLKTPGLDKLHAVSVRFTDFHVAPVCTPTRGQLMTGVDAMKNGATWVAQGRSMILRDVPTVAEYFRDEGYATALFGKWHLGDAPPHRPHDRGFDEVLSHRAWGVPSLASHWNNSTLNPSLEVDAYHHPWLEHNGTDKRYEGYVTDILFDQACGYMTKMKAEGKPFFVYLATPTPHVPNIPREDWVNVYHEIPLPKGLKMPATYYGMIENIDENIGSLLVFLEKEGLRDNTVLVFLSDNGSQSKPATEIYNAGMRDNKRSLFEGGHRVPLFISWPAGGVGGGLDVDNLIQVQDLAPTLMELCRLMPREVKFPMDGVSIVPLLKGEKWAHDDRMLVVQYGPDCEPWQQAAVLYQKWRLVGPGQLFDLRSDPGQKTNVADRFPEITAKMKSHYDNWYTKASNRFKKPRLINIGQKDEPSVILYASDWDGDFCDNPGNLSKASGFGKYHLQVLNSGTYRIEMSRWPLEANMELTSGEIAGDKVKAARPIAHAILKVNDIVVARAAAGAGQTFVAFDQKLKAGTITLEGVFLDNNKKSLCGAMYLKINWL